MKTFYVQEPHLDGTKLYAPGDKREVDENEVKHLVDLKVLGDKPPAVSTDTSTGRPDYERDSLKTLDLKKASKDQLLVIAAYEQATVPQGDGATEADIIKAVEAKRAKV